MFISYSQKKGFLYASITTSRRDGAVVTKEYVNLGRVLDKERGIYRNRQKGVFTYDINTDTYGPPRLILYRLPKQGGADTIQLAERKSHFSPCSSEMCFSLTSFTERRELPKQ